MAILKCKMCGGDLNIEPGMTVCECEYCSTKQTVPTLDDDKKVKLFERANRLRMDCQFDKAATVYESIIEEFDNEAEGYWGNLLCKYGIEYVDDPATGDKVPTCHRSSFDSFMDDPDFDMVMENCDALSRNVYREHAKQIEEIRKGIIEVSGKEEPYDIFICYKETAEDGQRTLDSVLAQDIYDALTDKGYRVFFSRITLEDKLGTEYEPYIFAALNSAKIMLAFGTTYDYYNAVWVKNEWSRYLKLMAKDKTKYLIPCYKDIDAYDIPKEFAKLQAQDLGKVGATQDLIRGIEKIIPKKQEVVKETVVVQGGNNTNVVAMVKRGNLALEDKDWAKADGFFEEALNQNPECAEAYLGKLMVELKVSATAELKENKEPFDDSLNYQKVMRFGNEEVKAILESSIQYINERDEENKRLENNKRETDYQFALLCLGLVYTSDQEPLIIEEKNRHNEVYAKLQKELNEAELDANQNEELFKNEKFQIENEYEQSATSLNNSLETAKLQHAGIIRNKEQELASLGILAGKRKRELSQEIENDRLVFCNEENRLATQIDELKNEYHHQISSIEQKLMAVHDEEKRIQTEIDLENEAFSKNINQITSGTFNLKRGVDILKSIGNYKDCDELLARYLVYGASVGDIVAFGKYKWKVLKSINSKLLLITENAIALQAYRKHRKEDIGVDVTWEASSLRTWLNNDFYNEAFSSAEQSMIMTTTVNQFVKNIGANCCTEDKIFLLSVSEAEENFSSDDSRACMYDEMPCLWWLISQGWRHPNVAYVEDNGRICEVGTRAGVTRVGVRPVMWINLEQ